MTTALYWVFMKQNSRKSVATYQETAGQPPFGPRVCIENRGRQRPKKSRTARLLLIGQSYEIDKSPRWNASIIRVQPQRASREQFISGFSHQDLLLQFDAFLATIGADQRFDTDRVTRFERSIEAVHRVILTIDREGIFITEADAMHDAGITLT